MLLGQAEENCVHSVGDRRIGRNSNQIRRQFGWWLISSVQLLEVFETSVGRFGRVFIPKLKPIFDFIRTDLEFYELNWYVRFLAFVAEKLTESARRECGVENDAVVRLRQARSAPSATAADRGNRENRDSPASSL